ncbi:MAG: hydrogenase maturation protease [Candidatus Hydrogenedentes bacterium]|nr:hydrogenase maturation protease [Candidatus Hydrogenedentota bacterium]
MNTKRTLILGYGNPGRQDDGLGPAIAEAVEAWGCPKVAAEAPYQLNIEDAATLAEFEMVVFVDAGVDMPEPYSLKRVEPVREIGFSTHSVSPGTVLALCEDHFHAKPEAYVLAVRGYAFEFGEGLTLKARENMTSALACVQFLIGACKETSMESKKTILAIDDDPDIRATLRIILETEGFSVGEAANGEEGLKAIERVKPDAILIDLMMESVDSGSAVAQQLKATGYEGPVYMLSSAGDTVRYNLDARELGLAGIFQKPIDPKTLVATLKAKLKV